MQNIISIKANNVNFEKILWYLYKFNGTNLNNKLEIRNFFIEKYLFLAKKIARKIYIKNPNFVSYEEVLSNAYLGLIEAVEKFNIEMGYAFPTFAVLRIKGQVIDGYRSYDICTRRVRANIKLIERTKEELSIKLSRNPNDEEIKNATNISDKVYKRTKRMYNEMHK